MYSVWLWSHESLQKDHGVANSISTDTLGCYQIRLCFKCDPAWPPPLNLDPYCWRIAGSNYLSQLFYNFTGFLLIHCETGITCPLSSIPVWPSVSFARLCSLTGERASRLWGTTRRSRSNWRTWKPAWGTAARKSSQVKDRAHKKSKFTGEEEKAGKRGGDRAVGWEETEKQESLFYFEEANRSTLF